MAQRSEITAAAEWYTGTDHLFQVTVYKADGTRQDISGWALSWLVKRGHGEPDAAALITKTTAGSPAEITIVDGPQGELEFLAEAADTRDLPGGRYVHELKLVDAGEESVLMYGPAVLKRALHAQAPT